MVFIYLALVEAKEKYAEWKKAKENKAEQDLQKMSKKPAPFKHIKVDFHELFLFIIHVLVFV